MNESSSDKTVSRRTLVKGAAWSVPVIAMAASTPLAAASAPTDFSTTLTGFTTAPAAGTGTGNQGTQALLAANTTFNTFGTVTNLGPGNATSLKAQVTFDQTAVPNEFTANAPWVVTSVTENTALGRWVVNLEYQAPVAAGTAAPQFILETRTRLGSAFPAGQSGAYEVLGRAYNSDGTISGSTSDYFYVIR